MACLDVQRFSRRWKVSFLRRSVGYVPLINTPCHPYMRNCYVTQHYVIIHFYQIRPFNFKETRVSKIKHWIFKGNGTQKVCSDYLHESKTSDSHRYVYSYAWDITVVYRAHELLQLYVVCIRYNVMHMIYYMNVVRTRGNMSSARSNKFIGLSWIVIRIRKMRSD